MNDQELNTGNLVNQYVCFSCLYPTSEMRKTPFTILSVVAETVCPYFSVCGESLRINTLKAFITSITTQLYLSKDYNIQ